MKTEIEIRQMIAALRSTLRNQADPDSSAALAALLWAVGDAPSWSEAFKQAAAENTAENLSTQRPA